MSRKQPDSIPDVRIIRIAAATTVVGLAGIAGAISYSHMRHLAELHGEHGWRAPCFPLSVDGIEIVASLVLLYHRRAGTRAGPLPWIALAAGTLASLAANVAVGATDLIGRAVAGWPAVALLVAVKLLAGLIDSHPEQSASSSPATRKAPADTRARRSRTAPMRTGPPPTTTAPTRTDGPDLERAARTALATLTADGERLNRDNLTRALRRDGHTVSNARAGELLSRLRTAAPAEAPNSARPDLSIVDRGQTG